MAVVVLSPAEPAVAYYNVNNLEVGGDASGEGNLIKNANYGVLGVEFGASDTVTIAGNRITDITYQPQKLRNKYKRKSQELQRQGQYAQPIKGIEIKPRY